MDLPMRWNHHRMPGQSTHPRIPRGHAAASFEGSQASACEFALHRTAARSLGETHAGAGRHGSAAAGAQAQFTSVPVGTTSAATAVTVTAQSAGNVAGVQVLTMGVAALDFAPVTAGSTCATAVFTAAGQTCTEQVTFTPGFPGMRAGAVVLLDVRGAVLGTAYLSGTGLGALGILVPGNLNNFAGVFRQYSGALGDGLPATQAELDLPTSMTLDSSGNMYIADSAHNRIREVAAPSGVISTIAGNGDPTYSGDGGPATQATLSNPSGVALDGAGNLYIADAGNNVIREISAATGVITTVAGNGKAGYGGDGLAASSATVEFNQPQGITVDENGNLYVADTYNQRIRRIDAVSGIITTVAGNGFTTPNGSGGFSGDNGQASLAELNFPYAVGFDASGNMFIPDSQNNRVRKVTAVQGAITGSCIIKTIAGRRSRRLLRRRRLRAECVSRFTQGRRHRSGRQRLHLRLTELRRPQSKRGQRNHLHRRHQRSGAVLHRRSLHQHLHLRARRNIR